MSIGFKTPAVAHLEQGEQEKMWKKIILKNRTRMKIMSYLCRAEQTDDR